MIPTELVLELSTATLAISIAFATTVVLVPVLRRVALRYDWVDKPDLTRKLHKLPTPTLGGVAIAAGILAGSLFLALVDQFAPAAVVWPPTTMWLGAGVLVAAGMYDDTRGLGFKQKFALQIVVAYLLLHAGYRVDVSELPLVHADLYGQALFSIPLTMLWIVGVINAVNLIDGLDGLAGGVSAIAFSCFAVIFGLHGEPGLSIIALVVSGALIGFLAYNFNPASIFMGDTGSLLLGYMLAVFSLSGTTHVDPVMSLLVPIAVLGVPITDTLLSMFRRVRSNKAVCAPDSDHIHHRLSRIMPVRQAVLLLYGVALLFGASAVVMAVSTVTIGWSVFSLVVFLVTGGLFTLGYFSTESGALELDDVLETEPSVEAVPLDKRARGDVRRLHPHRSGGDRDHGSVSYRDEQVEVGEEVLREVA